METKEEILKDEESKADTEFRELITTYSEDILKLMAKARADEREKYCQGCAKPCILEGRPDKGHPTAEFCPVCVQEKEKQAKQAGREEAKKEKCCYCDKSKFGMAENIATLEKEIADLKSWDDIQFNENSKLVKQVVKMRDALEMILNWDGENLGYHARVIAKKAMEGKK